VGIFPGCAAGRDPWHLVLFHARAETRACDSLHGPARKQALTIISCFCARLYVLDCVGMTLMTFAIGGIAVSCRRISAPIKADGSGGRGLDPQSSGFIFAVILAVGGLTATLAGGMAGDALRTRFRGAYFLVSAIGLLAAFPCAGRSAHALPYAWIFSRWRSFACFSTPGRATPFWPMSRILRFAPPRSPSTSS